MEDVSWKFTHHLGYRKMFLEWMAPRAEALKDTARYPEIFHIRWKMIVRPESTGWP